MNKYRAWWPEDGEAPEDGFEVEATDPEEAAIAAAERDFRERDGWERKDNQQTVEVEDAAGHRWTFSVERDYVEIFYASERSKT